MALKRIPVPIQVELPETGTQIVITWPGGRVTRFRAFDLRTECPCAGCVDEMTGRRTLRPESVDPGIRAASFTFVGRYALRFVWSDGHDTGIYTYERLADDTSATT